MAAPLSIFPIRHRRPPPQQGEPQADKTHHAIEASPRDVVPPAMPMRGNMTFDRLVLGCKCGYSVVVPVLRCGLTAFSLLLHFAAAMFGHGVRPQRYLRAGIPHPGAGADLGAVTNRRTGWPHPNTGEMTVVREIHFADGTVWHG